MSKHTTKGRNQQPKPNRLPVALILVGVALAVIAAFALLSRPQPPKAPPEVTGRPNLSVERELVDHGQVKLGTTITDVVKVTNTGDQTLTFTQAPYLEVIEGC